MNKEIHAYLLLVVCIVSGCDTAGPPLADVKGKVTLYGRPLKNAVVTFEPEGGGPAAVSPTDDNGDFELWSAGKKGAAIGKHRVSIVSIKKESNAPPPSQMKSDDPAYAAQALGNPTDYKKKDDRDPVPSKYNKNSELTFDVASGSNTANFDLK